MDGSFKRGKSGAQQVARFPLKMCIICILFSIALSGVEMQLHIFKEPSSLLYFFFPLFSCLLYFPMFTFNADARWISRGCCAAALDLFKDFFSFI